MANSLSWIELPPEILERIFSHLRLRVDVNAFQAVCYTWYTVSQSPHAQEERWVNQRLTCALGGNVTGCSSCFSIGEFVCELCEDEAVCETHSKIICMKCNRRVGPKCCVAKAAICIECCRGCDSCKKVGVRFVDCPWDFNCPDPSKMMLYCTQCDVIFCMDQRCRSKHLHDDYTWKRVAPMFYHP